jgi:hypothetical protein
VHCSSQLRRSGSSSVKLVLVAQVEKAFQIHLRNIQRYKLRSLGKPTWLTEEFCFKTAQQSPLWFDVS